MSRINGDKARFNIARKKSIQRRMKTQELFRTATAAASTTPQPSTAQPSKKPGRVPAAVETA